MQHYDGEVGEANRFMLNGQRLLCVGGDKGKPGSIYETEAKSFSLIEAGGDEHIQYFEVKTKDGTTYIYGAKGGSDSGYNSIIEKTGESEGGVVHAWLLQKVTDRHGNYMTYHYHEDNENGEYWLEEVKYTGNEAANIKPYNSVKFIYEERIDQNTTYYNGKHKQTVLLKNVQVLVEGDNAWEYDFNYQYNEANLYSRLVEIIKKDKNGTALNPIHIEWERPLQKEPIVDLMLFGTDVNGELEVFDYNGDGLNGFYNVDKDAKVCKIFVNHGREFLLEKTIPLPDEFLEIIPRKKANGQTNLVVVENVGSYYYWKFKDILPQSVMIIDNADLSFDHYFYKIKPEGIYIKMYDKKSDYQEGDDFYFYEFIDKEEFTFSLSPNGINDVPYPRLDKIGFIDFEVKRTLNGIEYIPDSNGNKICKLLGEINPYEYKYETKKGEYIISYEKYTDKSSYPYEEKYKPIVTVKWDNGGSETFDCSEEILTTKVMPDGLLFDILGGYCKLAAQEYSKDLIGPKRENLASSIKMIDYDGDGTEDLLYCNKINGLWEINPTGLLVNGEPKHLKNSASLSDWSFLDINGDGASNVFKLSNKSAIYRFLNKEEFEKVGISDLSIKQKYYYGDFNGDGKTDILTYDTFWYIYFSKGDGYERSDVLALEGKEKDLNIHIADVNGDGKSDIIETSSPMVDCYVVNSNGDNYKYPDFKIEVYYSDGDGFYNRTYTLPSTVVAQLGKQCIEYAEYDEFGELIPKSGVVEYDEFGELVFEPGTERIRKYDKYIGDFNGDGKIDLFLRNNETNSSFLVRFQHESMEQYVSKVRNGLEEVEYVYEKKSEIRQEAFKEEYDNRQHKYVSSTTYKLNTVPFDYVKETLLTKGDSESKVEYSFKEPHFDIIRRSFIGFGQMSSSSSKDGVTVTNRKDNKYNPSLFMLQPDYALEVINGWGEEIRNSSSFEYSDIVRDSRNSRVYFSYQNRISGFKEGVHFSKEITRTDNNNPLTTTVYQAGMKVSETAKSWAVEGIGFVNRVDNVVMWNYNDDGTTGEKTEFIYTDNTTEKKSYVNNSFSGGSWEEVGRLKNTYNAFGNVIEEEVFSDKGNSRITAYTYEKNNRWVASITNFEGKTALFDYDPRWLSVISETDYLGHTTKYKYSDFGELLEEELPNGYSVKHSSEWDFNSATDNKGVFFTKTVNPDNSSSQVWFDALGRVIRTVTDEEMYVDQYYNDTDGINKSKVSLPHNGSATHFSEVLSDLRGRPLEKKSPLTTITYKYTDGTDGSWSVTMKDENATNQTEKKYNMFGQLTESTDHGGTIKYLYHDIGTIYQTIYDGQEVTTWYDKMGRKVSLTDPSAGQTLYEYDEWGNLVKQTDAKGNNTVFEYDEFDKLKKKIINGVSGEVQTADYSYTSDGFLELVKSSTGYDDSFKYDDYGRIIEETNHFGGLEYTHLYGYHSMGHLISETYKNSFDDVDDFKLNYNYDGKGRLKSILNGSDGNNSTIYEITQRDFKGNVLKEIRGNYQSVDYEYDLFNRLTKIHAGNNAYHMYSYKPGTNNLGAFSDGLNSDPTIPAYNPIQEIYSYEDERLVSFKNSGTYRFDNNGNMLYNPLLSDGSDDNMGYGAEAGVSKHALTMLNIEKPDFVVPEHSLTFDAAGNVTKIVDQNGGSFDLYAEISYNASNQRRFMKVYDDNLLVIAKQYAGATETQFRVSGSDAGKRVINYIGVGSGLLAMHVVHPDGSSEIVHCIADRLGSPISLFTDDGVQLAEYSYDPWGRMRKPNTLEPYKPGEITYADQKQSINWFHRGYTGHEMMFDFNLINMNARLYDPLVCRFLSPDNNVTYPQYSQSYNRYAYGLNNPLRFTDPTGNDAEGVAGFILGLAWHYLNGVNSNMGSSSNPWNPLQWNNFTFSSGFTYTPGVGGNMYASAGTGNATFSMNMIVWDDVQYSEIVEGYFRGGRLFWTGLGYGFWDGAKQTGNYAWNLVTLDGDTWYNTWRGGNFVMMTYDGVSDLISGEAWENSLSQWESTKYFFQNASFFEYGYITGFASEKLLEVYATRKGGNFARGKFTSWAGKTRLAEKFGCFIAGTIVKTNNGDENIESLEVGDLVWSYNVQTRERELKPVEELFVIDSVATLVRLRVGSELIITTPEHPFYINGKWIFAENLRVGDNVMLFNNTNISIITAKETFDSLTTVYNFKVKDNSNYYVTKTGVLVHNNPCSDFLRYTISPDGLKRLKSTEIGAQSDDYVMKMQKTIKRNDSWEMMDLMAEPIHIVRVNGNSYILNGHNRVKAFSGLNKNLDVTELSPNRASEMYRSKMQDIYNGLFD